MLHEIALWAAISGLFLNVVAVAALYRKMVIRDYQHGLMWDDYAERKGLVARTQRTNGRAMEVGR